MIFNRKVNEIFYIGDDVKVTIIGIRGGQVRLGIEAPKHVAVHRKEVYENIQRNREKRSVK